MKVFSATMYADRASLGDRVSSWIAAHREYSVVDVVVTQSSDNAYHCIAIDNLRGTAACRGEAWAESVARRCRRDQPWPRTERATAIARRKVADLARDPQLLELLAGELARWAERQWGLAPTNRKQVD